MPGNRIPSVPRNRVKLGVDYAVTDAFKVGGDALFVSSQYFAGDESNQATVAHERAGVEHRLVVPDRKPHAHD